MAVVAAVLLLILSVGVAVSLRPSARHVRATPAPRTAPSVSSGGSGANAVSGDALALQLAIQPVDIGAGWVSLRAEPYPPADLNPSPTCLPGTAVGSRSAGAIREYSRDLQPNGLESGHLISVIFLQASSQDAAATRSRLQSPDYDTCEQATALMQVTNGGATAAVVTDVAQIARPVSTVGIAERLSISFTVNGMPKMQSVEIFDLIQGRVESRLIVQQCSCSPVDPTLGSTLAQTIASRVQASGYGQ